MSQQPARTHQRLLAKTLLLLLLPVILVVVLITSVNAIRVRDRLGAALKRELVAAADLAAATIDGINRQDANVARSLALAQEAGLFAQRERTLDHLRAVLTAHPTLHGTFIAYEPDADMIGAVALETGLPRESMDASGRFLPYLKRKRPDSPEILLTTVTEVDDPTNLWYHGTLRQLRELRRAEVMVTAPYDDEGALIVEFVYPIVIGGVAKGVAGVERTLAEYERILRTISGQSGVELLVATRGKVIASTFGEDWAAPLRLIAESPLATLFTGTGRPPAGTLFELAESDDDESHEYVFATVPTGDWTLLVRMPRGAFFAELRSTLIGNAISASLGLLVVAGLIVAFALAIRSRVRRALLATERIAAGDLTQPVEVDRARDETADLLRGLNTMSDHLNGLVANVQHASIRINSTANELAATSRQQEETVSAFGASTSEIAAAARQIAATSTELGQTMESVEALSCETSTLARSGRSGLDEMDRSMRRLDEATRSIAEKLGTISEKASAITGMVTTISRVADQTNLLSVNAAIEAEKAGDYGAGFLVVAREIRRLADQTGSATVDIERMVGQMQSAVSSGVMEMDRFAEAVRHGVGEVERIGAQFTRIIEQVEEGNERFTTVNEGMRSQSEGAAQISEAMGTLTSGARQTMEAAGGFAQAARDLQEAIAGLKSSIAIFRLRQ